MNRFVLACITKSVLGFSTVSLVLGPMITTATAAVDVGYVVETVDIVEQPASFDYPGENVSPVAHDQMIFPSHIYRHEFDAESPQPGSRSTANENALLPGTDDREALILGCLASGMPNKEISRLTGLSDPATKMAVRKLLNKIGAKNRVQAAVWAEKNGYALDV
jgi:DNA-binding NarL/FixJ family response regulator